VHAAPRLILEIDIGKLLPVKVADDETGIVEFSGGLSFWGGPTQQSRREKGKPAALP